MNGMQGQGTPAPSLVFTVVHHFLLKKGDIQCRHCFQNKQNRGEWVFLLQDVSISEVY